MKINFGKVKSSFFALLALLLCAPLFVCQVEAQTSKKKKTTKKTTPSVAIMPTSQQTLPAVISRADEFPAENQVVVTETQPVQQEQQTDSVEDRIDQVNTNISDLKNRIKSLESTQKNEYDEKQKRLLLNLDILTRAEQRSESLRKQLFEIIEKQNGAQTRYDQLDYDSRPEIIERYSGLIGSLKPEEVRDARRKALEKEKQNLQSLLLQIQANRASLEESVQKADLLVEKLRAKLEKDIDDALAEPDDK